MADRVQKTVIFKEKDTDLLEKLSQEAKKSRLPFSSLLLLLAEEAMVFRQKTSTSLIDVSAILQSLHFLTLEELARVSKHTSSLLEEVAKSSKPTAVSQFVSGWDITKLSKLTQISTERLTEIQNGASPQPEELEALLQAGLDGQLLESSNGRGEGRSC